MTRSKLSTPGHAVHRPWVCNRTVTLAMDLQRALESTYLVECQIATLFSRHFVRIVRLETRPRSRSWRFECITTHTWTIVFLTCPPEEFRLSDTGARVDAL